MQDQMTNQTREDRVRLRAYEIWVNQGRLEGRDQEHWQQACAEIDEADATQMDFENREVPTWLKKATAMFGTADKPAETPAPEVDVSQPTIAKLRKAG